MRLGSVSGHIKPAPFSVSLGIQQPKASVYSVLLPCTLALDSLDPMVWRRVGVEVAIVVSCISEYVSFEKPVLAAKLSHTP